MCGQLSPKPFHLVGTTREEIGLDFGGGSRRDLQSARGTGMVGVAKTNRQQVLRGSGPGVSCFKF
jgi:hypothetical protein